MCQKLPSKKGTNSLGKEAFELSQSLLTSHAVGDRYCLRCRYGRCAAKVVFFAKFQNFVGCIKFLIGLEKNQSRLSQTLSAKVRDCRKQGSNSRG